MASSPSPLPRPPAAAAASRGHTDASPLRHFLGGWLGGSIACVLLSPLEVVKTRLQSSAPASSSALPPSAPASGAGARGALPAGPARMSAVQLGVHIVRSEGVGGLYRGLVPHLLGVGPARAFYFGTYNIAKRELSSARGGGWHGAPLHLTAAAIGSVVSATLMSPVWVIKTRLQLQASPAFVEGAGGAGGNGGKGHSLWTRLGRVGGGAGGIAAAVQAPVAAAASAAVNAAAATTASSAAAAEAAAAALRATSSSSSSTPPPSAAAYRGMREAFVRIYREEGMSAFYRGLTASYLGVFETAAQFALYGALKEAVIARRIEELRASGATLPEDKHDLHRVAYSDLAAFTTSAAAKLVAAVATYPHEVLRTRMREQRAANPRYRSVLQSARLIVREEGWRALYGGLGVHMVRTVPNAAILLMVVERVVGGEV
jgi:solute carrier family 25 protein 33/36